MEIINVIFQIAVSLLLQNTAISSSDYFKTQGFLEVLASKSKETDWL